MVALQLLVQYHLLVVEAEEEKVLLERLLVPLVDLVEAEVVILVLVLLEQEMFHP